MSKEDITEKTVLGIIEDVEFKLEDENMIIQAKIDTGATKSSIDIKLASELKLGPIVKSKLVKSAHGTKLRPIVWADIVLKGKPLRAEFTLADRTHMTYPVLIGVNILKQGFLVDPSL
ncbi:MAG: RimK/LysX family protein [Nanoarchaeota archaeon]|nr:RimK/LysX family protein [Nanoarchaeota archaeon]